MRENHTSAILAIVDFTKKLPIDHQSAFSSMMASDKMPMEWEMENDIIIAKEKLALLPLCAIAPELEQSSCDLDDLKAWYKEALRGARMVTQDIHTDECLQHVNPAHDMCDYSATCPRRFSYQFVMHSAIYPDFTKDIYKTAPKREFIIVRHKLDLAISQGLIGFDQCEDIREKYGEMYEGYMNSRSLSAPDNIV